MDPDKGKNIMMNEYLAVIKKVLHAKSASLYNHAILTANILQTIVTIASNESCGLSISMQDAYILGIIHDIGKTYINDVILNKQESLSEREWETIKMHTVWGKTFVDGTVFEPFGKYIIQHHEKHDGTGYPNSLKGDSIHTTSYFLNIADQIASIMEDRPYKRSIQDKTTILSLITPNIQTVFHRKTQHILSQAIDIFLVDNINMLKPNEYTEKTS